LTTEIKPLRVHDVPEEMIRLRKETAAIFAELKERGPTRALALRAKDLRKRIKHAGSEIERLLCMEEAKRIAILERTGREAVDGDDIALGDQVRAKEIVNALLQSKAGKC
jgi:hypothetical protein